MPIRDYDFRPSKRGGDNEAPTVPLSRDHRGDPLPAGEELADEPDT